MGHARKNCAVDPQTQSSRITEDYKARAERRGVHVRAGRDIDAMELCSLLGEHHVEALAAGLLCSPGAPVAQSVPSPPARVVKGALNECSGSGRQTRVE